MESKFKNACVMFARAGNMLALGSGIEMLGCSSGATGGLGVPASSSPDDLIASLALATLVDTPVTTSPLLGVLLVPNANASPLFKLVGAIDSAMPADVSVSGAV